MMAKSDGVVSSDVELPDIDQICTILGYPENRQRWTKKIKFEVAAIKEKISKAANPGELRNFDWKLFC